MSLTRRNVGQVTRVPMKTNTTINMGGIVCADATGYAVPGSDATGLRVIGIAAKGVANTGASGAKFVPVWTQGTFKMTGVGLAITDQGKMMYAGGAATVVPSSTYGIEVGVLSQYISATSGWVTIGGGGGGDVASAGLADGAVTAAKLATDAVETLKIKDGNVTKGKLAAGISAGVMGIIAVGEATTSREDNAGALATAITLVNELNIDLASHGIDAGEHTAAIDDDSFPDIALAFTMANSLKAKMNAHAADALVHTTAVDNVNFPVATADADDLTKLIALISALQDKYVLHDDDAELADSWAYHAAQETANHSLTSTSHPTTFGECLTRLADLQAAFNAHDADDTCHGVGSTHQDSSDGFSFVADDYVTMMSVAAAVLAQYDLHDADAELASPVYHAAQEAGDHSLTSAVAPTTLQEAVTRLNDLKAKYNAHDADGTAHGTDTQHQIAADDASYGAAHVVEAVGVLAGDIVVWSILDDGTGNVKGVSAVAGEDVITFTFSADPQNDAIISYAVLRATT